MEQLLDRAPEVSAALDRLLADTLQPGDLDALRTWAGGSPRRSAVVGVLADRSVGHGAFGGREEILAELRQHVRADARRHASSHPFSATSQSFDNTARVDERPKPMPSTRDRVQPTVSRITPAIGVAVALSIAAIFFAEPSRNAFRRIFGNSPSTDVVKEYRTAVGQRARFTLPDSSTVVLAPESKLRYTGRFGSLSNRTVTLEGQALFTVTHTAGAPFIVQTGNVATRVLGTSFAVRRYADEPTARIIVAEGRVAVGQTVLTTGDVASALSSTRVTASHGNAVNEQLAWTQGRLVFYKTPLRDVVPELERWYGITLDVSQPALLDRLVSTTLDTETTSEAIDLVAIAVKGRVRMDGRRAVITSP